MKETKWPAARSGRWASPSRGYALGRHVDNVDHYLLPIVGAVVTVSMLPLLIELIRERHTAPSAEPEPS